MNSTIYSTPFSCGDQKYLKIFLYKSKNLSDFFAMIVSGVSIVKKLRTGRIQVFHENLEVIKGAICLWASGESECTLFRIYDAHPPEYGQNWW